MPSLPMDEFLGRLKHFSARGFDNAEVLPFLRSTLIEPASLESWCFWSETKYMRNLVFHSPEFEVLVLCWPPGKAAPAHGHEGEMCWARVERGRLRFVNYRELSRDGDRAALKLMGKPVDGDPGHVDGPADIHSVANLTTERAVSLHVYTRPYLDCDVYDLETGTVIRKHLKYDTIDGSPVP